MGGMGRFRKELDELNKKIGGLSDRVEQLELLNELNQRPALVNLDNVVKEALKLPTHLQRTFLALNELKTASASDVSNRTGISRPIESLYLNELVRLGFASKRLSLEKKPGRQHVMFSSNVILSETVEKLKL